MRSTSATLWCKDGAAKPDKDTVSDVRTRDEESTDGALRCRHCGLAIARQADLLHLDGSPSVQVFTNPAGLAFEICTLSDASHLREVSEPTSDYSWFRGYCWQIVVCVGCTSHLGWRFDAVDGDASPARFYGLKWADLVAPQTN